MWGGDLIIDFSINIDNYQYVKIVCWIVSKHAQGSSIYQSCEQHTLMLHETYCVGLIFKQLFKNILILYDGDLTHNILCNPNLPPNGRSCVSQ